MKKLVKDFGPVIIFFAVLVLIMGLLSLISKPATPGMLKDANGKVYASGLDIAIEVEDKEITARQLFEAAAEDLTYANHINADVEYSYSEDTRYTGDLNMGNLMF